MNFNASTKYRLYDYTKSIIIFYTVIPCVMLLLFLLTSIAISSGAGSTSLGGMEFASVIFLFIVGLTSFKDPFRMLIQNGVSRKMMFQSLIQSFVFICVVMALIDKIIALLSQFVASLNEELFFIGMFEQLYGQRYLGASTDFQMSFEGLLFNICFYLMFVMVGYFISVSYYRMNKGAKVAVSVGVPVFFFVALPIIDASLTNGVISGAIYKLILFVFGFSNGSNPYYGMVTCLLSFALFGGLSWLLMKKAVVKD